MTTIGRVAKSAWLAFALAAIFFYPLAAALDSDPYYLQWQPAHSTEAAVALAIVAGVLAVLLYVVLPRNGRGATIALGGLALVPLLSLGAGLSRQLPIDDVLRSWWENGAIRYGAPGIAGVILVAAFALRPAAVRRALERLLLVLSPISVVVVISLVRASAHPGPVIAFDRAPSHGTSSGECPSMVAMLFDELSYAYVYDGSQVRPEFPAIAAFASQATNYLNVRAPGDETLISVPGYLAGQSFDNIRVEGGHLEYERGAERAPLDVTQPDGLFATARRAGFSREVVGYYFPYCEVLNAVADVCRSFSFYNLSTIRQEFSPLHAVMTTFILWPRQFPLGLFKNPPFAALQRATVEETEAFTMRPLDTAPPVFRFVHFSIPHLPFVFGPDGYDPPFDPLRQRPDAAYVNQLRYSDRLFGEIVTAMQQRGSFDRATIVLFSDHGFRSGGRETNSRHVPFLVKKAGQTARVDVIEAMAGERLLLQTVRDGCREAGATALR
jgi:hypothetical protein